MADTVYLARSNYFHVLDQDAFNTWAKSRHLHVEASASDKDMFAIFPDGAWPEWEDDADENDNYVEIDLVEELSKHLIDDEVAILKQIFSQKLRFVGGTATAVISDGSRTDITLSDIYSVVSELYPNMDVTEASY